MGCHGTTARSVRGLATAAWVLAFSAALGGCPTPDRDACAGVTCREGYTCVATADGAALCMPPADPCGANNPCKADETCVVTSAGVAKCLAPNLCANVTCAVGKACDPATGECTVSKPPCEGVRCPVGQACSPDTGRCQPVENKCALVCCGSNQVCDPSTGDCVADQCASAEVSCKCGPAQACEPISGACVDIQDACGNCGPDQYCDSERAACVTIARGLPAAGHVGAACAGSAECGQSGVDGFCVEDGGLFGTVPGGFCSAACEQAGCPSGSQCVNLGIQVCLDLCLSNDDCRDGFSCLSISSGDPRRYCFPQGAGGSECEGEGCAGIGGACVRDSDCIAGSTCQRNGFPGGYCQKRNCLKSGTRADCDEAAENCLCLDIGDCAGTTIALGKCNTVSQNCRPGYACYRISATGTDGYCYPRSCNADDDCTSEGSSCDGRCDAARGVCDAVCKSNADCWGGRACDTGTGRCYQACRAASDNCGPDGICDPTARRCVRKCATDEMCAAGTTCDRLSGRCAPLCTSDAACRDTEFCDAGGRCRPRCEDDAGCGTHEYCEERRCLPKCTSTSGCTFGEFCDTTNGRCHPELRNTLVGRACANSGDCGAYNATCLTGEGYDGGYCIAGGCSDDVPCPSGAACIPHGASRACFKACTPGDAASCRAGYTCAERSGSSVCVPD